ncbi:DUF2029 domain-containing protein [bacterium]|nr:DUF2029 domain-containing protein [bacterium]
MIQRLKWLLLIAALSQFLATALPPGNDDIIGVQSAALDIARGDTEHLYPGKGFAKNEEWLRHSAKNHELLGDKSEPQWLMYPPLYPWLLSPFASLGSEVWRLGWAALQIIVLFAFLLLLEAWLRQLGIKPDRVLLLALLLGSYPIARVFQLGQTSMMLSGLLWFGLLQAERDKSLSASLLMGCAVYIKPFAFAAEFVRLLKRKWIALVTLAIPAVMAGLTILILGWQPFRAHIEFLKTLSGCQTAFWGNQSLLGALLRLFSDEPAMWYGFEQDQTLRFIASGLLALFLIMALVIQLRSRTTHSIATPSLWLNAVLLGLSLSWEHHAIFLLPAVAFLWTTRLTLYGAVVLAVTTLALSINLTPFFDESFLGRTLACVPALGRLILFILLAAFHFSRSRLYKETIPL